MISAPGTARSSGRRSVKRVLRRTRGRIVFFQQIEVGEHAVFSYLIGDPATGAAVVVDPAGDASRLLAVAEENGLTIQSIVNTHGHIDHVMGNAEMQERTGAEIMIHEAEAEYLQKVGEFWVQAFRARRSPAANRTLVDGDKFQVGPYEWVVLHTPGHTPGGICLYNAALKACLTGDTLFVGSIGRTDGPHASTAELLHSIRTRLLALPGDTVVYPGHNYGETPTSTVDLERQFNPFLDGDYWQDFL